MKILPALNRLFNRLYASLKRFPIPIGLSTVATILAVTLISLESNGYGDVTETLSRIALILVIGIPLTLSVKLVFEQFEPVRSITQFLVYAVCALLLAGYYFFLFQDYELVSVTRYISISIALYLWFLIVPFLHKKNHFEDYLISLFLRLMVTILYTAVLFAGIAIILFTINSLLNIPVGGEVYGQTMTILIGIFAPCFFLAGVPDTRVQWVSDDYSKWLKILLLYIIMPLVTVYTIILYIYFAKIVITWHWPEGLVGHLVLWYSVVSIGVILGITPLRDTNKWAEVFARRFPIINLPILIMMFISIGIRIHAYGLTENRYYVVALGIWVAITMICLSLVRIQRNMLILALLACIAVVAVIGPFSSYAMSKTSQNERFERLLIKHGMLDQGVIIKPAVPVPTEDQREMNAIVTYFKDSHELDDLRWLPDHFQTKDMETVFGFPYQSYYPSLPDRQYVNFYVEGSNQPYDVQEFDYFFDFSRSSEHMKDDQLQIMFNNKNQDAALRIEREGQVLYERSLADYVGELVRTHGIDQQSPLTTNETTFTDHNEKIDLRLVILSTNGRVDDSNRIRVDYLEFYLFVKVK